MADYSKICDQKYGAGFRHALQQFELGDASVLRELREHAPMHDSPFVVGGQVPPSFDATVIYGENLLRWQTGWQQCLRTGPRDGLLPPRGALRLRPAGLAAPKS